MSKEEQLRLFTQHEYISGTSVGFAQASVVVLRQTLSELEEEEYMALVANDHRPDGV
jgi:hypothetical protein